MKFYAFNLGVSHLRRAHKLFLIMKLIIILMTGFLLQAHASTFAQTVSYTKKNASIKEVFQQITRQTGYEVLYADQKINNTKRLDVNFQKTGLKTVLEQCLDGLSLTYVIDEKTIVIKPIEKSMLDKVLNVINPNAARIEVKGKVLEESGGPLPGATIVIVGTSKRALTNANGEFMLDNVADDAQIKISYLGYETQTLRVKKDMGTIKMALTTSRLKEVGVVSTGYQQIDRSKMTGAAAEIKARDLTINGTVSLEQMLQGKLPGVEVVNNSGQVGTRQTVRVRGTSTLLGNQEPVWVVDGMIQEDPLPFKASELNGYNKDPSNADALKNFIGSAISWLNPYDIEDITVLKDAASTAIYGVKAANGVIVINTKRGKSGRAPSISYNTNFSTQSAPNYDKMNLMNSKERVDVSREIYQRGLTSSFALDDIGYSGLLKQYLLNKLSVEDFNAGAKRLETNNTNWFDLLYDRPLSQNHNVSLSGGGNESTYYASLGYNNQRGTAKGNGMDSYMATFNFTSNVTKKFSVNARLSGNYTNTTAYFGLDPYRYAASTSRVIPAYQEDGSLSYYRNTNGYLYNILNEMEHSGNDNIKANFNTAIMLKYELPAGFRLESILGAGFTNTHAESYASELTNRISLVRGYEYGQYGPLTNEYKATKLPIGGELAQSDDRNINYTWRNSLSYGQVFNKKHSVSGMLGMEMRSNGYKGTSSTIFGYLPDRGKAIVNPPATVVSVAGAATPNGIYANNFMFSMTDRTANYLSYYLTAAYSYDNRYVFSGSIRGDASNRFGQDTRERFNPIWALGGRWNVSREHFFDRNTWLSELSFRGSYGYQGNVAENYGPDLIAKFPIGGGAQVVSPYTGESILKISSLPYADLRWEKTQSINLGMDFGVFENRISGSIDYYSKNSKDLIVMKDVPFENGVTQMPMNGGSLRNYGVELSLSFIPLRTKTAFWMVSLNSSKNINKVTNKLLPNPSWNNAISGSYFMDGFPVSSFWVFDYKGLNPLNGTPEYNLPTVAENLNAKFDAAAFMKYAGKLNADFTGGFNTSFRYRQFTISTSLYASLGGHKLLAPLFDNAMSDNVPSEYLNLSKDLVNRWSKPGDEAFTNIPSIPFKGVPYIVIPSGATTGQAASLSAYTAYNFSNARLVNASYLRINNVSVSYILPPQFVKRIMSKSMTIGYTMSNVHTFVSKDFKGVDPEVASGRQPLPQAHVLNLSVTF